jgi:diamine N-acetyltransferase
MANVLIKEIRKSELDRIKPLWEGLNQVHLEDTVHFREHYLHFTFEKRADRWKSISEENILIIIAEDEYNHPVGYCVSTIGNANEGEIDSLFVEPTFRGQNIGYELMTRSLNWLKKNGCKPIRLAVSYGHESVLGFYGKLGFFPRMTVLEWE